MPNRYTPEELLFALQVREFANNIRKSHAPGDLWGSDRDVKDQWFRDNPIDKYVGIAMTEVNSVAGMIRGWQPPPGGTKE
ncbi:hypothetical protein [Pseudomonas putida]|uniref:hypothetical protein n=1 Tax=Pseudomonas putida TaxID=303 RepID=UPI000AD159A4|nr:hypothetical protein [Pseudomonas putida]